MALSMAIALVPLTESVSKLVSSYEQAPLAKNAPNAQTTFVYDRNGKLLTTLHAAVNRVDIPVSHMPLSLQEAVIASEDEHFYRHGGVSFPSILRAALADLTRCWPPGHCH